ncbi:MAG: hypothetical protein ACD_79C00998G0004 [uncultured bacterium]|nr:MAG: hypothetical protein ACD_79C00998G0004 [uncultured bacterium]
MKLEVKNKIKETEDFYKEIEIIALNRSKAFKILGTIPDDSFENVSKAYHSRLNEYQSCISEHLSPDKKNDILKKIEEVEWAFNLLYPAKK